MKARVAITVLDGFHYRYLIQTGLIQLLADRSECLYLFGTNEVLESIKGQFRDDKVVLRLLPIVSLNRLRKIHLFVVRQSSKKLSKTLNLKSELLKKSSFSKYLVANFVRCVVGLLGRHRLSNFLSRSWRCIEIEDFFSSHSVDLVVLSTPGQKLEDLPFLYTAKRLRISTISPVYSWDNLTAKGPFIISPQKIVVWNDIMKREATYYHDFLASNVLVGGVPVFDRYFDILKERSDAKRRLFLTNLGIGVEKKVITLATIPPIYFGSSHRKIAELIISWISAGELEQGFLLIRPHPLDVTNYDGLACEFCKIDSYGSKPQKDPRRWRPTEDNIAHLGTTMAYSSVVINIASTITIDASCFDTPVINVAFDIKSSPSDYEGSVSRYYEYTHYKHVVDSGASMVVTTVERLKEAIQLCLKRPDTLAEGRLRLVSEQVGQLDGRASERTGLLLLSENYFSD